MPRLEVLFAGCLPVITNAPPGLRLCVECGEWKPEETVTPWEALCKPYSNRLHNPAYQRYVSQAKTRRKQTEKRYRGHQHV